MSGAIVADGRRRLLRGPRGPAPGRLRARPRPARVARACCFLATASGDADGYVARFYRAFVDHDCYPSDLALFDRQVGDLRRFVLEQDVIYVGGGNTASPARGLARARPRRDPARGARRGAVPVRRERRDELLVRGLGHRLVRPRPRAAGSTGSGLVEGSACPHYDSRAAAPPRLPPPRRGGLPRGLRGRQRRGAALRGRACTSSEAVTSRRGGPRLPRRAPRGRRRRRAGRSPRATCGDAPTAAFDDLLEVDELLVRSETGLGAEGGPTIRPRRRGRAPGVAARRASR